MKNIIIAIRSLFKKGRHNIMKILSLSIGLAIGLVLIAKVYFEQSYDTFYPDAGRTYRVYENINQSGDDKSYGQVSGGVAVGMKSDIPAIEAATRLTYINGPATFVSTSDKQRYATEFPILMADSNVFSVLPVPILLGNPIEVLAKPGYVMISRKLADKMGGIANVRDMTFKFENNPVSIYTIGGVFEDIPENTHLRYDMLVSMAGMSKGSLENWIGNDRYLAYVRLTPGVTPESLAPAMREMQERHQDMETIKKLGVELSYSLKPMLQMHAEADNVKSMIVMLALLAFALLFTAVMNYILIAISSIVNRTKEVAVHKSYGASERNIHSMIMSETLVHMLCSLVLALFIIFLSQDLIEELLNVSVGALLFSKGSLVLLGVCAVVFLVTGFVPGALFARIPVAAAFRNFKESKRIWKLGLLFLQFTATGLLVTLLFIIGKQYSFMVNDNPGYAYERLAYSDISGVDSTTRYKILDELMRLPEVEKVTTAYSLPLWGMSGNNIGLPGSDADLFNIADQYWVSNGYLDLMEIPVVEGRSFLENVPTSSEVMVNRNFVEKMKKFADWPDGPIGKSIYISEHNEYGSQYYTICGVYENYRIGSLTGMDDRPSVLFYRQRPNSNLVVKFRHLTAESVGDATAKLKELMPDQEPVFKVYQAEMVNLYSDSRKFRNQVLIGGLITWIISLIGLIGYTNDEVNRRRREIAIRKVNGAVMKDIMRIFLKDIMPIALPATLLGSGLSYFVAQLWQEQFVEKVPLTFGIFATSALFVCAVVVICVVQRLWFVANDNPVDSIKSE